MKKYLLFLMAMLPAFTLVSCSSSDEEPEAIQKSSIVGEWEGSDKILRRDTLRFLDDNTCSLKSSYMEQMTSHSFRNIRIKLSGTYQITANKVSIKWQNKQQFIYKLPESSWEDQIIEYATATFEPAGNNSNRMVYTGESAYRGYSQTYFAKIN